MSSREVGERVICQEGVEGCQVSVTRGRLVQLAFWTDSNPNNESQWNICMAPERAINLARRILEGAENALEDALEPPWAFARPKPPLDTPSPAE